MLSNDPLQETISLSWETQCIDTRHAIEEKQL